MLARDSFLPRQLLLLGDRLVYSNGIILLSILAAILIIIFQGQVNAIIPLYAVAVFTRKAEGRRQKAEGKKY